MPNLIRKNKDIAIFSLILIAIAWMVIQYPAVPDQGNHFRNCMYELVIEQHGEVDTSGAECRRRYDAELMEWKKSHSK